MVYPMGQDAELVVDRDIEGWEVSVIFFIPLGHALGLVSIHESLLDK
jgi:hypothetical protein